MHGYIFTAHALVLGCTNFLAHNIIWKLVEGFGKLANLCTFVRPWKWHGPLSASRTSELWSISLFLALVLAYAESSWWKLCSPWLAWCCAFTAVCACWFFCSVFAWCIGHQQHSSESNLFYPAVVAHQSLVSVLSSNSADPNSMILCCKRCWSFGTKGLPRLHWGGTLNWFGSCTVAVLLLVRNVVFRTFRINLILQK